MGKDIHRLYEKKDFASIGIGALVVFIAMVLVAGIAASVIIQTSSNLETQSMSTGRQTTGEVATGLTVYSIEGYAATGSDISKLAIMVRLRAGSEDIDLSRTYIELSDSSKKIILNYTTSYCLKPNGLDDVFSANVYPDDNYAYGNASNTDGTKFGVLVFEDIDNSITATNPVMNRGDKVYLCINATGALNNIAENTGIWGQITPEQGSPGLIQFTTPFTYADNVMELFWNI